MQLGMIIIALKYSNVKPNFPGNRTLQRLRKDNLISYTMLRGKCLYKLSDIEKSLQERIIPSDPRTLEELRKKYMFRGV